MSPTTVVIVGGGFAGTTLARALEKRLPAAWQLLLVSEESYTTFNPMLAEVVGAAVFPEHVVAPIRGMLKRTRFVMGRVQRVDTVARTIHCETLAGAREIAYGHLVLAFGQRARLDLLPGLAAHALPLKLVGDAVHIRNRALQTLARIELSDDAEERRALGRLTVIGGGFSGVEVAGALADFVRSALRHYPRVDAGEVGVTLLHDGRRLLPELPQDLGDAAAASLHRRGVTVRLGVRATAVDGHSVLLEDGRRLETRTIVCTIGTQRNSLVDSLPLDVDRGRIVTRPDGSCGPRHAGLWALGDCAAVPNAATGQTSPPTAQFAVAQAQWLAGNLRAFIDDLPTRPFHHRSKGSMATTGHLKGVAEVFGLRLTGLPAWLLWRAYYLLRMPTLSRKLRIWVEWTWSMCFAADITHLRFERTGSAGEPVTPQR